MNFCRRRDASAIMRPRQTEAFRTIEEGCRGNIEIERDRVNAEPRGDNAGQHGVARGYDGYDGCENHARNCLRMGVASRYVITIEKHALPPGNRSGERETVVLNLVNRLSAELSLFLALL